MQRLDLYQIADFVSFTKVKAPLLGVLFLIGCGGSSTENHRLDFVHHLIFSSSAPSAGFYWSMDSSPTEVLQTEFQQAAVVTLGDKVRVLHRVASFETHPPATQWLVYAPGSQGLTRLVLLRRTAAEGMPKIGDLMCSSSSGNPVDCTLVWTRQ
jgi:hypothetical protein